MKQDGELSHLSVFGWATLFLGPALARITRNQTGNVGRRWAKTWTFDSFRKVAVTLTLQALALSWRRKGLTGASGWALPTHWFDHSQQNSFNAACCSECWLLQRNVNPVWILRVEKSKKRKTVASDSGQRTTGLFPSAVIHSDWTICCWGCHKHTARDCHLGWCCK